MSSDDTGRAAATARIDEVVARLGEVVDRCVAESSRVGYFAAVYRRVTITIGQDVGAGRFAEPGRVAEFDETFANRFLEADEQFRAGRRPTEAWTVAFEAARRTDLSILQQLLLGINAHIRLDLGVTAAALAGGGDLRPLRGDFEAINSVLAGLVPASGSRWTPSLPGCGASIGCRASTAISSTPGWPTLGPGRGASPSGSCPSGPTTAPAASRRSIETWPGAPAISSVPTSPSASRCATSSRAATTEMSGP